MDKLDRLGIAGVRDLLGAGREDESGAFTVGAGLSVGQVELIEAFLSVDGSGSASTLEDIGGMVAGSDAGRKGAAELAEIMSLLSSQGISTEQCSVDTSIVRGLGYYTGPVMEAELTAEITDRKGRSRRFGSVIGGGRYDGLVKRFTGQEVPATGISVGVDRLLAALDAMGTEARAGPGPVVVTVMDRDRMGDYQRMVSELRAAGIRSEVFLGNARNIGRQMKYADMRGSPLAVIQGSVERERGIVQIKDLALGKALSETATHEEWKTRPSQREVPRSELVSEVARILRRMG